MALRMRSIFVPKRMRLVLARVFYDNLPQFNIIRRILERVHEPVAHLPRANEHPSTARKDCVVA